MNPKPFCCTNFLIVPVIIRPSFLNGFKLLIIPPNNQVKEQRVKQAWEGGLGEYPIRLVTPQVRGPKHWDAYPTGREPNLYPVPQKAP